MKFSCTNSQSSGSGATQTLTCLEWTQIGSTTIDVQGSWAQGMLLYQGLFMFFLVFGFLAFYFKNR